MNEYIENLENGKKKIEVQIAKKRNQLLNETKKINEINKEIQALSEYRLVGIPQEIEIIYFMHKHLISLKKQEERAFLRAKRYTTRLECLETELFFVNGKIEELKMVKELRKNKK